MEARSMWKSAASEMQVSQEELKSSNEELQSTNEELQSTNEEMSTTKEEIQSLNEELNIINEELLVKMDELQQANDIMKNLMDSTSIATLFLDRSLVVKTFTKQMSAISKLIPSDVGRPVTDISSKLFYPELAEDVAEVISTLRMSVKQVQSDEGMWFNVRILPFCTLDGKVNGVVVTFMDITESKNIEMELQHTKSLLEQQVVDQDEEILRVGKKLKSEIEKGVREAAASKEPGSD
jgi:two-component system CheB/CheR fusion protein